jgi:hypothetical protein
MATTNYEISEIEIPREYSFKDEARIQVNGKMLDILVTEYTESHADNNQVSNMLSDSTSLYTYGSLPIDITLEGLVKESKESDHLYDVLKQYKQKWRQRLITDYTKNTKLTIMDTTMNLAILTINLIKNVDMIGYDTITITGIGWNYSFPAVDSDLLYSYGAEIDLEKSFTVDTSFKFDENSGNKQTEEESITPTFKFDQNSGATTTNESDSITPTFKFNPSGETAFIEKG